MPSPDEAAKIIDAPGRTRRSGNGTKLLRRTQAAGAREMERVQKELGGALSGINLPALERLLSKLS